MNVSLMSSEPHILNWVFVVVVFFVFYLLGKQ